jgi:hypothetical protein
MDGLRPEVKGLLEGLGAEVDLAVDVMVPAERLAGVLLGFVAAFPTVQLKLHVEALGAVNAMLLARTATPCHPLGRLVQIPPGAGRDHI